MYGYIARSVFKYHLGSSNDPCYIQKCYNEPCFNEIEVKLLFEPRHEKTGFLHLRKQRRRSASL